MSELSSISFLFQDELCNAEFLFSMVSHRNGLERSLSACFLLRKVGYKLSIPYCSRPLTKGQEDCGKAKQRLSKEFILFFPVWNHWVRGFIQSHLSVTSFFCEMEHHNTSSRILWISMSQRTGRVTLLCFPPSGLPFVVSALATRFLPLF